MIKQLTIWHLKNVVAAMNERLAILEAEPCDYEDYANKANAIFKARAQIYRVNQSIKAVESHRIEIPHQVKHLLLVSGIIAITILGMIVLPIIF